MFRLLSVILYLNNADAILQYLHRKLTVAPKGAFLIIADVPYQKTENESSFEKLVEGEWELIDSTLVKRYPQKGKGWTTSIVEEIWSTSYPVISPRSNQAYSYRSSRTNCVRRWSHITLARWKFGFINECQMFSRWLPWKKGWTE